MVRSTARLTLVLLPFVMVAALVAVAGCAGSRPNRGTEPRALTTEERARQAQSFLRAGRTREAIETMRGVVDDAPDDARMRILLGQVYFVAARYEAAEEQLLRALELDAYLTDAHNYLGVIYTELERYTDAERHFRSALDDPSYPTPQLVWFNLGKLFGKQGRDDEAVDALRRAVEIDSDYYQAHYELALLLEKVGRLQEAVREFKVAGPGFSQSGEYYYRLGLAHFRAGQMIEAKQALRRVAEISPGSPSAAAADDLLEMIR